MKLPVIFLNEIRLLIFYLDKRLRNRFGLFTGIRSKKEDNLLYIKIYSLITAEILRFIDEHLPQWQSNKLQADLKGTGNTFPLLLKSLHQIPDGTYKLYRRLDHFINNLLIRSLRKPAYGR